MDNIIQIISTVGFPMTACLILGWYVKSLTDKLFSITEKFNKSVSDLTEKINELLDRKEE